MPSLRVNLPTPGAPESASHDSLGQLVRLLVNRILESRPKSSPQSNGAGEEILYESEIDGARYLLVRVTPLKTIQTSLSPREQEIVRMVAEGHPNKVIADVLNISAWTVCTHLRRIFAKFGVASRAAMVARFLERDSPSGRTTSTTSLFDIFRMEKDGSLIWCEVTSTLESAKSRAKTLARSARTQYIVVSKGTGQCTIFDSSAPSIPPKPPASVTRGWYQICRIHNEKLRRVESAESLQIAEARIKALKASSPGDYFVLDYDPESSDSLPSWTPLSFVLVQ
jgi:two-component system nitrate/nitrite response regulator NarL